MVSTTTYRQKVAQGLTYPLGLGDLQIAMAKVAETAALEVAFLASPMSSASRFRQVVARDDPYLVAVAACEKWDKKPSLGGDAWIGRYLNGKWSVRVYPVARARRAIARRALILALPKIADWIGRDRSPSWYFGRKSLPFTLDPLEGTLRSDEHVDKV